MDTHNLPCAWDLSLHPHWSHSQILYYFPLNFTAILDRYEYNPIISFYRLWRAYRRSGYVL